MTAPLKAPFPYMGGKRSIAHVVWHGQREILAHLGAEVERQWSQRLRALPGQLVACYDEHGREVPLEGEPRQKIFAKPEQSA
jgi:hypothetical protein